MEAKSSVWNVNDQIHDRSFTAINQPGDKTQFEPYTGELTVSNTAWFLFFLKGINSCGLFLFFCCFFFIIILLKLLSCTYNEPKTYYQDVSQSQLDARLIGSSRGPKNVYVYINHNRT